MSGDDPATAATREQPSEGEPGKPADEFGAGWIGRLNAFTDQPLGGIIMRGVFQIFVFGVFLSYVDAIVSARAEVKEAAAEKRGDVLALKEDLLSAANTYRNTARRAQQALTDLRFERFRATMNASYPRAREAWLALEPIAVQRWIAIHGAGDVHALCPVEEGTTVAHGSTASCDALRAWIGGHGKVHYRVRSDGEVEGVWSIKRRFHVIDAILEGTGASRVAPDRSEWVQCRERAEAVFTPRRQSCLNTADAPDIQHACMGAMDAALADFQVTHCLSREKQGGRLRGHIYCLLASQPEDDCRDIVGMDGFTDRNRPPVTKEEQEILDKDEVLRDNRLTMDAHARKFPNAPVTLADAIAEAVRLTDRAAADLAAETCRKRRASYAVVVRWFIPECDIRVTLAGPGA